MNEKIFHTPSHLPILTPIPWTNLHPNWYQVNKK
jgi:hypothetical protein